MARITITLLDPRIRSLLFPLCLLTLVHRVAFLALARLQGLHLLLVPLLQLSPLRRLDSLLFLNVFRL
jgi:hypothetical protein